MPDQPMVSIVDDDKSVRDAMRTLMAKGYLTSIILHHRISGGTHSQPGSGRGSRRISGQTLRR